MLVAALLSACQTTGGPPRDEWVKLPKDLLRMEVDSDFYGGRIEALGSEAEAAWLTGGRSQRYLERLTFSGPRYVLSLHLRMLPKGWHWTVPESVVGLQDDLRDLYGWTLGEDIELGAISVVRTGFPRSFYARFSSKGRQCAGMMIASGVGGLSNSFRNTVIAYICASAGSASSLSEETIVAMMQALRIKDAYYNGGGFSDEQIRYFKGKQEGVVLRRHSQASS